ncbi:protein of unknown function [Nitrospira japonica]|uniref:Uncharacterized protein n=1 Tax=Nitrospira japonica TaxID=1325564 RepID=A0A1W1I918_9BACT|nr:hypothetical protein [Nitrospira japonica]SLM49485.1 protein of unknown function [Nitrospira japonica]
MFHDSFLRHSGNGRPCPHCSSTKTNEISQYLLGCSHLALQRCGQLLLKAAARFDGGEEEAALEQAIHSREELDRSRYLEDQWRVGLSGTSISVTDIETHLKEHLEKQECNRGVTQPPRGAAAIYTSAPDRRTGSHDTDENDRSQRREAIRQYMLDVIGIYTYRWDRLQSFDLLNLSDPELAHAYMRLSDRLTLPAPPDMTVPRRASTF